MADLEVLASRYRVVRKLGAGGMGVVYLVEDMHKHDRLMALKTLKMSGDALAADNFRAEFRHVHGVIHPNIPEVFDFGTLPGSDYALYFTTEFIDGQPLDTVQKVWPTAPLHAILVSLCRALAFLHSRGLLHRDIKPENVLAKTENGEITTIKLVDFGLAALASGSGHEVSGTIDYLAPELINGGPATVATDIYALGMLLYRLATGRLPFDAQDPLALAKLRTTTEAPPPLRFRPDLPVGLSDVISALVRLNPEDRPLTARHVIALLNEREGTEFPYETAETRTAYIRSAASVTNTNARELLKTQMRVLKQGATPPNLMIIGLRGLGRTRLLKDFATELTLDGITARLIESDDDCNSGEESARVCLVPSFDKLTPERLRKAIDCVRSMRIWWIVAGDAPDAPLASALGGVETAHLAPMGLESVRRFAAATFPENNFPDEFARNLYTHSLGLPSAVQDIFDRMLDSGLLRIGLSGWELLPGTWEFPLHRHIALYVRHQLTRLPEPSVWLARVLACSASMLPETVAANLAAIDECHPATVIEAKEALIQGGWLNEHSGDLALVFSATARYLREQLAPEARKALHQKLSVAWTFENVAAHPRQPREVLFHDFNAGSWIVPAVDAKATLHDALHKGQNAWVRQLVSAGLANDPPPELRAVMLHAQGNLEYIESNLGAAAECFGQILNQGLAEVTDENSEAFARYAMIEEKLGRADHAEEMLLRCQAKLSEGHDSNAGAIFGTLAWIAFKRGEAEQARLLAEEGLVRVPPQAMDAGFALLLNTVATLAFYGGDLDAAAMAWKRCLEVNEALGDRKGIANMYNNLGVAAAQSGDRLRARGLWEKCVEIAREIHDMHRLAGIYNNLGIDALETGGLSQAEEYYLKALAMFRTLRSPRDQVELLSNLGELSYYRADYARAQAYWQEAVNLAASVGDHEGQIEPLVYLGKLLAKLEDLEKADSTLSSARDLAHELSVKKGEGQAWEGLAILYARQGNGNGTAMALRNAHVVLSEEVDPLAALHLHLTECSLAAAQGDEQSVQNALRQARKVADTKWDPYTAARTLVYGLLFAQEQVDHREHSRILRQLSVYPDLLWMFHWATGRRLAAEGAIRRALEEYGRGVSVLKAIASRLSEDNRQRYLHSPIIGTFKAEALDLRNTLSEK